MKSLLALMVVVFLSIFTVKAQPTLSITSFSGAIPGDTVLVHVLTNNFNGTGFAASFACTIDYNFTNLTYLGPKNSCAAFLSPSLSLLTNGSINKIHVSWYSIPDTIIYPEGQIFDLQFIYHAGTTALNWDTNCYTNLTYNNAIIEGIVFYSTYSLIDVNKKWVNSDGTYGTAGPPPYFMHSNICRFDTNGPVINNYKYAKLMYSTDSTESQWTVHGYMRETPSGKIFFVSSLSDTAQKLIYDFGASIGDTLNIYTFLTNSVMDYIVDNVDSVFFAGQMRKSINNQWYSGVGSEQGLLSNFPQVMGWFYYLSCYFEDGTLLYHQQTYPNSSCFLEITGIDEFQGNHTNSISILPNPVIGISTIQVSETMRNDPSCKFELYNLMGECVSAFQLSICKTITKGSLADGLYFYKIINTAGIVASGKVILQ